MLPAQWHSVSTSTHTNLDPKNGQSCAVCEALVDSGQREQRNNRGRLLSRTRPLPPRPSRVELERACRIALMEEGRPSSIETIYDRIVRRGSVMFFGYRRPLRAIAVAMSSLARNGEVSLVVRVGSRSVLRRGCQRLWTPSNSKYRI